MHTSYLAKIVNITKSNVKSVSGFTPSTTLLQNRTRKFNCLYPSEEFAEFLDGHAARPFKRDLNQWKINELQFLPSISYFLISIPLSMVDYTALLAFYKGY